MSKIYLNEIAVPNDLHIFILEDEAFFQKKMMETLGDIGFKGKVTLAKNVEEAKGQFENSKPDFILSDWNLPDGIGIEFLKTVRANSSFDHVPFLMVTTMDDIGNILEAVNLGADGYIVKPWEESDVIEKMGHAFEKRDST